MEDNKHLSRILIIQTAFIGDVILATGVLEKLHQYYPVAKIDFLLRKGNESLLEGHPFLNKIIIWNKRGSKYLNLIKVASEVRSEGYDLVVNLQRFLSSGYIAIRSRSFTIGFKKNPLSKFFSQRFDHSLSQEGIYHEIDRNHLLIKDLTDDFPAKPKLYPTESSLSKVKEYTTKPFVCIAPASVWFTKQLPKSKWTELISSIDNETKIYLIGAPSDFKLCQEILSMNEDHKIINLAGKLSLMESIALLSRANRIYVNDSAPLHMGSALNTPTTAFFCSTLPEFGFGPLADDSEVKEVEKGSLSCRPCGIHGKSACPEGHFNCALKIPIPAP